MAVLKKIILLSSIILFSTFSQASDAKKYDVVGIGKAMVDIISYVSEDELANIMPKGFKKADSAKVSKAIAEVMLAKMENTIIIPGVSEANIIADIASLGGKVAFKAIASDDDLGFLFKNSMIKEGVDYLSPIAKNSLHGTARCFTFITPDKNRTFAVAADLSDHIDESYINYEAIKNSKVFFTDASNLDYEGVKSKITVKALSLSRASGGITAFNLNNNRYVDTYRGEIISILPMIDIIIASEKEAKNLFQKESLDDVLLEYLKFCKIVVITRSKQGAVIATKGKRVHIPSIVKEEKIVDLNGAGDGFAAGFLYGYTHNKTLLEAGRLGAITAAQIIYQAGARPKNNLRVVLHDKLDS